MSVENGEGITILLADFGAAFPLEVLNNLRK